MEKTIHSVHDVIRKLIRVESTDSFSINIRTLSLITVFRIQTNNVYQSEQGLTRFLPAIVSVGVFIVTFYEMHIVFVEYE